MDLPVTFEDATVDYGTVDFGGNVSAFVADPADASNTVVQTIKTSGAQTWAGTSLASGIPEVVLEVLYHSRLLISAYQYAYGHHAQDFL